MKERFFYWIPRVLTVLAILFLMLFSLDVFDGNAPLWKKLIGFLIHNIPVWILTIVLILTWKYETIGGMIFIIAAIAGGIFFFSHTRMMGSLIVMIPFLIVGILFILHDRMYVRGSEMKV